MGNLLKNTILVGTSEIASKGIIALAMILLVRTLSPESYGLYSLSITLTYFFIGFIHSGFYTIGMREIAKYPHLSQKYVNNVILLKTILAFGSYMVLVLIVILLDKPNEAKITFLLSGLFLFLLVFHIDWLFRGLDRMEITSIGSVMQGITILVFIYFFVKKPNDYQIAVIGYLLSWFVYILFENFVYVKKYDWIKPEFDKEFNKILIKASLSISLSSLIVTVYANNNILILNLYKGDYETGIYSAMVRLMNLILLPNSILQIAFFPEISRSVINGSLKLSQQKYLVVLFVIGFFAMFGMFGYSKDLLLFIFGEKYLAGDVILKISLIACLFSYLSASAVVVSFAVDKQKNFFYSTIVGTIISLALNLLLVPKFGALGAVISLTLTEFSVFVSLIALNKSPELIKPYFVILKPFCISLAALLISKFVGYFLNSYVAISIYVVAFMLLSFVTKLLTIDILRKLLRFKLNAQ